MREIPKYVNISSVNDFLRCRRRWCYKWVENRVPRTVPAALTVGKMIHRAFEESAKVGTHLDEALAALIKPFENSFLTDQDQKALKTLKGLVEPLQYWTDSYPHEMVLEVEEPFEFWLTSGAKFRGRPDKVVLWNGKVWHRQLKTIGGNRSLDNFLTLAHRNMHELIYGWYLARKYGPKDIVDAASGTVYHDAGYEYGGSIYDVIRKLKYRSEAKQKPGVEAPILNQPSAIFHQSLFGLDFNLQEEALEELNILSMEMDRTADQYLNGRLIPSTRAADENPYGHGLDPYTLVLMGEQELSDDTHFMDREDTYAEAEEVTEEVS